MISMLCQLVCVTGPPLTAPFPGASSCGSLVSKPAAWVQVALITGGTSGIGYEITRQLGTVLLGPNRVLSWHGSPLCKHEASHSAAGS